MSFISALIDVNECQEDTDSCDDNAYCVNTEGSFKCDNCKPGYLDVSGDGKICQGKLIYKIPIIILLPTWEESVKNKKAHGMELRCKSYQTP